MRHSRHHTTSPGDAATVIAPDRYLADPEARPLVERALALLQEYADQDETRPRSIQVADLLIDLGADQTTLLTALLSDPRLRDRLPDDAIQQEFGDTIAGLVRNVNWLNTFRECREDSFQAPEQAEHLRRMLLAMVDDVRAVLIKLGYRVIRLRILPRQSYETRRCIARETLDIYAPLANRLGLGQLKWELEDLAFRYLEPQVYKRLAKSLEENRVGRERYIQDFIGRLKAALTTEGIEAQVLGRPKHIYSIWKKMQRKHLNFEELYDIRAVRVITDKIAGCYTALGVVHSLWTHIPKEFDDYIAHPKENGYQSLHTAVVGPQGKVVEVQIRTPEMHEFAEHGVAAHWRYKEGGKQDQALDRAINSLRHLLEHRDDDAELLESFHTELFTDRVFVLTPRGDVIDMPQGSTPLDFAYAIHTDVGNRCRGAKVNGRIVPLTYQLHNGEQVEVLTGKQASPSRDWYNPGSGYLNTARARQKVRHWFSQQDRERNLADGRALLERECSRFGVTAPDLPALQRRFHAQSEEELLLALGRGDISQAQLATALQPVEAPRLVPAAPKRPSRKKPKGKGVQVRGVGNLLVQFARCCKPVPGDPIVGFITRGKGVTIHRQDCPNILKMPEEKRNRLIEVDWGGAAQTYTADLHIEAFDRQGLLRDITAVLSNEKVNVMSANTRTNADDQMVVMDLNVEIEDSVQLSRVLARIAQLPNVLTAQRRHLAG
ncbi:MAG: GTP diphosphokinase [Gammaproteobacteria bacterium]|jgi:GTP pyrophosphokinase